MEMVQTAVQNGIPKTKNGKPLYAEYTNKDGVKFKVINFDNEEVVPNKGIVEFEAFKKQDFQRLRDTSFSCPVVKDSATGIFYGLFAGFHPTGQPKWLDIPLKMINIYDRSIPSEAAKAFILANSSLVEGSPNVKMRNLVKFRLVDKEQAATDKIKKISDGKRALSIAEGLYGEALFNMARDLGLNTNSSITMLTAEVMEYAMENPIDFLKIAEHPHRETITVLNKAIATRVVENDLTKGYTYNGSPLGHNFDWAVKFLIENPTVAVAINMKATEKQAETDASMKVNTMEVKHEENNETEQLRKRLAEMEAKNAELLAMQTPKSAGTENPLQKKLDELLIIAKEKKLRGLHMYKPNEASIAKLEQAIAEKK